MQDQYIFFLISNETYIHREKKHKIAITGVHDGEHKKQRNKAGKKEKEKEKKLKGYF